MGEDTDARPPQQHVEPPRAEGLGFTSMGINREEKGGLYSKLRNEFEKGDNSSYDPDYLFLNLLDRTIPKTGFNASQDRPLTILDLGCGECREGFGLKAFFAGDSAAYDDVRLFGVDIEEDRINRARMNIDRFESKFFGSTVPSTPSYEFHEGDATNLDEIPQAPSQADVVLIRNQWITDTDAPEETWEDIFKQGYSRLTDNGIMIVTSRSNIEHEHLLEALRELNPDILLDEENPESVIDYEDDELVTGNDKHIVILRKKKQE